MANILILSAGRRVSLVRGFQSAVAAEQGLSAQVLAADMHSQSVEGPPLARPQRIVSSLLELIGLT